MSKKVVIVGHSHTGLTAAQIELLKKEHPDLEIVRQDEAKERGLIISRDDLPTHTLTDHRKIDIPKMEQFFSGKSNRNERRAATRKNRKKRRNK